MASGEASASPDMGGYARIIIVGAGVAGLSAANHLVKRGMKNILILEGRGRVGGRVIGIKIGNQPLELGASWVHGILGNPIYEMALANKLVDITHEPKPHNVLAVTEEGRRVPISIVQEVYDAYFWFFRRCEEYYILRHSPPEGLESVGEHLELEIAIYLQQFTPRERNIRRIIFDHLLKRECCISGCHTMDDIDLMDIGSYVELPGGNIILKNGYSSILPVLTKEIPDGMVLKKHAVTKIRWRQKGKYSDLDSGLGPDLDGRDNDSDDSDKTVIDVAERKSRSRSSSVETSTETSSLDPDSRESTPERGSVQVICENGKVFHCDHVICTLPLGVLKEEGTKIFEPTLPDYKLNSIRNLLFDTVDKLYLLYERPFLPQNVTEVITLWDRHEDDDDKPIAEVWYKKIYSFVKMEETVLLGWLSGREAEYMETLSEEEVADTCTDILRKFLRDPFIPKPKNAVCSSWHKQPFTRGTYTAIGIGSSQMDIENLGQPLYASPHQSKPTVLFAGEHTHPSFYSTVHGAYMTGRDSANVLLAPDTPSCNTPRRSRSPSHTIDVGSVGMADLSTWVQGLGIAPCP